MGSLGVGVGVGGSGVGVAVGGSGVDVAVGGAGVSVAAGGAGVSVAAGALSPPEQAATIIATIAMPTTASRVLLRDCFSTAFFLPSGLFSAGNAFPRC